jgi:hypothetical protein
VNWTAVTKRLTRPDRVVTEDARGDAARGRPSACQAQAQAIPDAHPGTEPTPALLRASSVRAFTPREAHVPRHRADVPTDWVGDHDELTEHPHASVAATA